MDEYECQLIARQLSDNEKPIDFGSKSKLLKQENYDPSLYEREQLDNNYHYYILHLIMIIIFTRTLISI